MENKNREEDIKTLIEDQRQEIKLLKEMIWSYAPYMKFPDEKTR